MALSSRYSSSNALNATRARQGRFGRHVFWVLLVSTVLAAAGMFFAWTHRSGDLASTEPQNRTSPSEAAAFNAPDPAPAAISEPSVPPR